MRLPSLLVVTSAITCSSPVLSGAGWRMTRAEYCWPFSCQLMVLAVVLVSSSSSATCCMLRESMACSGFGMTSGVPSGSGSAMTGTWTGDSAVVVTTAPAAGVGSTNATDASICATSGISSSIGVTSAVIGASIVFSVVPGSSSTSSTGSGAGCGSEASVNSSSLGPSRETSCTESSGTSSSSRPSTYIALPTPRRMMRCTAAEMPSEVLTSRWGRNAIQSLTEARLMTSAASRYALAYTGDCTRTSETLPSRPILRRPPAQVTGFSKSFVRWDRQSAAVPDPPRPVHRGSP